MIRVTSRYSSNSTRTILAVILFSLAVPVIAADSPGSSIGFRERQADFQRLDPGVPFWPSTCDCVKYSFGVGDAFGNRDTEFTIGNAAGDNLYSVSVQRGGKMPRKVPLKSATSDQAEFTEAQLTQTESSVSATP